jgi:DNA-binding NtrC family response regulator
MQRGDELDPDPRPQPRARGGAAQAFGMKTQGAGTALRQGGLEIPSVRVIATPPRGGEISATLEVDPLAIGTSADCDLIVPDPAVSRRHCEVVLTEQGVVLRDLGSKNGTFFGEARIVEAILPGGTSARIGATRLKIELFGAPVIVPMSASARFGDALGRSPAMRALFAKLERAAASQQTVLLLGGSGTGKELLARAIHNASPRREGPYVVLDCSAVAPGLIEDELFGHVEGAFPGADGERKGVLELSDGGTLFLDEIGELPLELQPKLLRALESRQVQPLGASEARAFDARVVAAAQRDLRVRVAEGSFRADLCYRLAAVELRVPPLRERKEDIPLLIERFLAVQTPPRTLADLPPNTLEMLAGHTWPGNVQELRNVVARLALFPDEAITAVTADAVAAASSTAEAQGHKTSGSGTDRLLGLTLRAARDLVVEEFERKYIAGKLRESKGNMAQAAVRMGVSRPFLAQLMERYGLEREEG